MNSSLELDDLKAALQLLDDRVARQHSLQLLTFRDDRLGRVRSGLRALVVGQMIQIGAGLLLSALSASFWHEHIGRPQLICYSLLLAYGLMIAGFAARDLVLIRRIDYAAPVLAIQRQLAELKASRLRAGLWFTVAGCFMWTPMLMAVFYWTGVDVWAQSPLSVYGYVASSFVCVALSYGLLRWSRRPGQERLAKFIRESSAGRSVTRAEAALAELRQFAQE